MSKKPARSKSGDKGGAAAAGQKWEQGLIATPLNEEGKWNTYVVFVVGQEQADFLSIDLMGDVAKSGVRRKFSFFNRKDLFEQIVELAGAKPAKKQPKADKVNDLGNPKGKKPKEVPQFFEVCESAKVHLDAKEDIPLPLLARTLKFKMLEIKQRDILMRESERKAQEGRGSPKKDKKDRAKSAGKKGKKTPEPVVAKAESKLKKRGEVDTTGKYIDDEPDDGPDHYIMISGFFHPQLANHLADVGVFIDSFLKVGAENYEKLYAHQENNAPINNDPAIAQEMEALRISEETKLNDFWKNLLPILQDSPDGSKLQDIARLEHTIQAENFPDSMEENEAKTKFGTELFEVCACMLFDLVDYKRQWKNYLQHLKLRHIPLSSELTPPPAGPEGASQMPPATPQGDKGAQTVSEVDLKTVKSASEVDMRYYNELINYVPQESVSVPLILHCMLEQIDAQEKESQENIILDGEEPVIDDESGSAGQPIDSTLKLPSLNEALAAHVNDMVMNLALTAEERSALAPEFNLKDTEKSTDSDQPLLIQYQDKLQKKLGHLKPFDNFNPMQAELYMLRHLPLLDRLGLPQPNEQVTKDRAARIQEFMHFCSVEGMSNLEISRIFRQFILEQMPFQEVDSDGNLIRTSTLDAKGIPEAWDDPYPYIKGFTTGDEEKLAEWVEEVTSRASKSPLDENDKVSVISEPAEEKTLPEKDRSKSPSSPVPSKRGRKKTRKGSSKKLKSKSRSRSRSTTPPEPVLPPVENEDEKKTGILKSSSRSSSISRSSGVNFIRGVDGQLIAEPGDDSSPPKHLTNGQCRPLNDILTEIAMGTKRNLDQWCFAEHLESKVLMQVLREAYETNTDVETYYQRSDHSLLVVLHNACNGKKLRKEEWKIKLHSDVGFRNYLEHVSSSIDDWLKGEEAKYQASILAEEVDTIHKDAEAASRPPSGKKTKKDRSKSPKKSDKEDRGRSSSRGSSTERPSTGVASSYIRPNSLKAQKEELEKLRQEEEEKEKQKSEKRSRSATKKSEKEKGNEKKPSSRASSKSKNAKEAVEVVDQDPVPVEPFMPFEGYDVGNHLLHMNGVVDTILPADGSKVQVEKIYVTHGIKMVKTTVSKDGHHYTVHILDPIEQEVKNEEDIPIQNALDEDNNEEKADVEKSEKEISQQEIENIVDFTKISEETEQQIQEAEVENIDISNHKDSKDPEPVATFGSMSIQFSDGLSFALSSFGSQEKRPEESAVEAAAVSARTATPRVESGKGTRGRAKNKEANTPEPEDDVEAIASPTLVPPIPEQKFQQLYTTTPDGLSVTYMLESSLGIIPQSDEDRQIVVCQSYPFKTNGIQECEVNRLVAKDEVKRLITSNGNVIKYMSNGQIIVLFPDGQISELTNYPPPVPSRSNSPQRVQSAKSMEREPTPPNAKKGKQKGNAGKGKGAEGKSANQEGKKAQINDGKRGKSPEKEPAEPAEKPEDPAHRSTCLTTLPSGERFGTHLDGVEMPAVERRRICKASDPQTQQVMHTRDDHVIMVNHPDGSSIVEHSDGTRITKYLNDAKVMNKDDQEQDLKVLFVQVECPGYATVKFDTFSTECSTELPNGTLIHTFPSGAHDIYHHDGTYVKINNDGGAICYPRPNNDLELHSSSQEMFYTLNHFKNIVFSTRDNEGTSFSISNTGIIDVEKANNIILDRSAKSPLLNEYDHASPMPLVDRRPESLAATPNSDKDDALKSPVDQNNIEAGLEVESKNEIQPYKQHAPRMFVINADGSGFELLRYQDVSEYISAAEEDPATAILMDPLIDQPQVLAITVLKPIERNLSEAWVSKYADETIIPPGLNSRDLKSFPAEEKIKNGPKFGSNLGRGLDIGTRAQPPQKHPIYKCPKVLETRHILQYRPVNQDIRTELFEGYSKYAEQVYERSQMTAAMEVRDPRSLEEQLHAADLLDKAYKERALNDQVFIELSRAGSRMTGNLKNIYEDATKPPVLSTPSTPTPRRKSSEWNHDAMLKQKEEENKMKLNKKLIPPYFQSNMGKAFLLTQMKKDIGVDYKKNSEKTPDISMFAKALPSVTIDKTNLADTSLARATATKSNIYPSSLLISQSIDVPGASDSNSDESNDISPNGSGTDNVNTGADGKHQKNTSPPVGMQISPQGRDLRSVGTRPYNPTPQHALDGRWSVQNRPGAPTPGSISKLLEKQGIAVLASLEKAVSGSPRATSARSETLYRRPAAPTPGDGSFDGFLSEATARSHSLISLLNRPGAPTPGDAQETLFLSLLTPRNRSSISNLSAFSSLRFSQSTDLPSLRGSPHGVFKSLDSLTTNSEITLLPSESTALPGFIQSSLSCFDCESNPYLKLEDASQSDNGRSIPSSVSTNVLGLSRKEPVRIPAYMTKAGRNNALPNERFALIEDPVRRQVKTTSIIESQKKGNLLAPMRGFQLLPEQVDFGILKEGSTYCFTVSMKNTGVDSCRFRIVDPPPSTGLNIFYKHGPVAAGMKINITVEIYAIAAGVQGGHGVGVIEHLLEIITETDHLYLPIVATVLPSCDFHQRFPNSPRAGSSPGVKFITSKPPAKQGNIRPSKPQEVSTPPREPTDQTVSQSSRCPVQYAVLAGQQN